MDIRKIKKLFKQYGIVKVREGKGSHVIYKNPANGNTTLVAMGHKAGINKHTAAMIFKQLGI